MTYLRGKKAEAARKDANRKYGTRDVVINSDRVERIEAPADAGGGVWVQAWVRVATDPNGYDEAGAL